MGLSGPEVLAFFIHCSANFQPIFDCFIPNFKLKYEHPDNIKADRVNVVVFNLHQIKRRAFFGTPGSSRSKSRMLSLGPILRGQKGLLYNFIFIWNIPIFAFHFFFWFNKCKIHHPS